MTDFKILDGDRAEIEEHEKRPLTQIVKASFLLSEWIGFAQTQREDGTFPMGSAKYDEADDLMERTAMWGFKAGRLYESLGFWCVECLTPTDMQTRVKTPWGYKHPECV